MNILSKLKYDDGEFQNYELKQKLKIISVKLLISLGIVFLMDPGDIVNYALTVILVYSFLSLLLDFIYIFPLLIFGILIFIVLSAVVFILWVKAMDYIPSFLYGMPVFVLVVLGIGIDVFQCIRCIKHRKLRDEKAKQYIPVEQRQTINSNEYTAHPEENYKNSKDFEEKLNKVSLEVVEKYENLFLGFCRKVAVLKGKGMSLEECLYLENLLMNYDKCLKHLRKTIDDKEDLTDIIVQKSFRANFEEVMRCALIIDKFYKEYKEQGAQSNTDPSENTEENSKSIFFDECDTIEKLDKRYHQLVKVFHPDQGDGAEETFKMLQSEYEDLKSKLK